jgi:putative acetyltransferase
VKAYAKRLRREHALVALTIDSMTTIVDLELRQATRDDVHEIADAHRDSIRHLGGRFYPEPVVAEWAGAVNPALYLAAMDGGEEFFIACGIVSGRRLVLGFSSDYRIRDTTHGTSAYVRPVAARRQIGSRLLSMAESFGIARGARSVEIEAALGAVEFYRANGFVETGRGEVSLRSGFAMPCVFMRKDLG